MINYSQNLPRLHNYYQEIRSYMANSPLASFNRPNTAILFVLPTILTIGYTLSLFKNQSSSKATQAFKGEHISQDQDLKPTTKASCQTIEEMFSQQSCESQTENHYNELIKTLTSFPCTTDEETNEMQELLSHIKKFLGPNGKLYFVEDLSKDFINNLLIKLNERQINKQNFILCQRELNQFESKVGELNAHKLYTYDPKDYEWLEKEEEKAKQEVSVIKEKMASIRESLGESERVLIKLFNSINTVYEAKLEKYNNTLGIDLKKLESDLEILKSFLHMGEKNDNSVYYHTI